MAGEESVLSRPDTTREAALLLAERVRVGLRLVLVALVLFAIADLGLGLPESPVLFARTLMLLGAVAAMARALHLPRAERWAMPIALVTVTGICFVSAGGGMLLRDYQTTPLVIIVLTMGTATLLQWGIVPQLATVAIAAASLLWNLYLLNGGFAAAATYPAVGVIIAMVLSVYVAHQLERHRVRAEQAQSQLRASEASLRATFEHMDDVFYRTDLQGVIQMVTPAAQRYGYRPEELIGRNVLALYRDASERERLLSALAANRSIRDFEITLRQKDGTFVPTSVSAHLLFDAAGQPIGREGVLRDITARKRAQEVQEQEAYVAGALARVGQALMSSLDTPAVLGRLCQLTTEVLHCDYSHTYLWQPEDDVYVVVAGYGDPPEYSGIAPGFALPAGDGR